MARALFADALELALLQHAQKLALELERDFADLVEEQRAAVGEFEAADAGRAARRLECALGVAEEFAFEQLGAGSPRSSPGSAAGGRGWLASWIARAINSLPVPDSPVISTAGVGRRDQLDLAATSSGSRALAPMMPR